MKGDRLIYSMFRGKFSRTTEKVSPEQAARANFVIICGYGDWSGFRTLAECEAQFAELEKYFLESNGRREYAVVER